MHLIQIDYPNKLILVSEKKRIIRPEKTRLHSKKSKRLKRTAALEAKNPNTYTALKD